MFRTSAEPSFCLPSTPALTPSHFYAHAYYQVIHMQDVEKISEEKVNGRPLAFRLSMSKQESGASAFAQIGAESTFLMQVR